MAGKLTVGTSSKSVVSVNKKSATSGNPRKVKTSSMSKSQKRSYKRYKGQGR